MTAEFAAVIPAVVIVLLCCLTGIQVASQQLRLHDAAAGAARSIARGDEPHSAGARLSTRTEGDLVCATLTQRADGMPGTLLRLTLRAQSCALAGGL